MTSTGSGTILTVTTLCEAVWKVERELDLLTWQIGGVRPWPIIRMRIFHELTRRSGLHGDPHPVRRTRADQARLVARHVIGTATRNPFLARGSFDSVVVPHPRKPGGVEIYTDSLRTALGSSALVLDSGINGTPLPGSVNLDFFTSAFGAVRGRRTDARCTEIAAALEAETGIKVPVASLVAREVPKHARLRSLYRSLLKRRQIKTVYVVVAYFHQHIVGAARDLGIRVVELQHGAISPYHLGYSYPGRPDVADQPDELWCFGSYWTDVAELPAATKASVVGASFVSPLSQAELSAKDPHLVVFLSQGTTGPALLEYAASLAVARPDLDVAFHLHPSERSTDYVLPDGVRLSAGNTLGVLASATYQVGVSTTALFEGMLLNCRTAVANLPGHEYLAPTIARGDSVLIPRPDALAPALESLPRASAPTTYYAPLELPL